MKASSIKSKKNISNDLKTNKNNKSSKDEIKTHGGFRKGSGRPKGAKNKKTIINNISNSDLYPINKPIIKNKSQKKVVFKSRHDFYKDRISSIRKFINYNITLNNEIPLELIEEYNDMVKWIKINIVINKLFGATIKIK